MNNYTLKNFRVFDNEGATFNFAPITILTGCNSSGKSTVTKSLMLFQELFATIRRDIQNNNFKNFENYTLNFSRGKHQMGNFDKILNWNAQKTEFSVSFSTLSHFISSEKVETTFVFEPNVSDNTKQLNIAVIKRVEIKYNSEEIYCYNRDDKSAFWHIMPVKSLMIQTILDLDKANLLFNIHENLKEQEFILTSENTYSEIDLEAINEAFYDNKEEDIRKALNWVYTLHQRLGDSFNSLVASCKMLETRNEEGDLEAGACNHSHTFENDLLFNLSFLDELDTISKKNIMEWVQHNIFESKHYKTAWFKGENFENGINTIFNFYVQSDFITFKDFYTHYENIYSEKTICDWGKETKMSTVKAYKMHYGSAYEGMMQSPLINPFEQALDWDQTSDEDKFVDMFTYLQGFSSKYMSTFDFGDETVDVKNWDISQLFMKVLCTEIFVMNDKQVNLNFLPLSRANTQRIYTFEGQGTGFNENIEKFVNMPNEILWGPPNIYGVQTNVYKKGDFLKKWVNELADITDVLFEIAPESVGLYVYVVQNHFGKEKKILLSDVGYGLTPLLAMLLSIEFLIMESLTNIYIEYTLCIEEPESNLHPNFQSRLAEIFLDATTNYRAEFIIETHSEYLIRKSQVLVSKMEFLNNQEAEEQSPFSVYYLPHKGKPYSLGYRKDGKFREKFGSGFYDESSKLTFEIL